MPSGWLHDLWTTESPSASAAPLCVWRSAAQRQLKGRSTPTFWSEFPTKLLFSLQLSDAADHNRNLTQWVASLSRAPSRREKCSFGPRAVSCVTVGERPVEGDITEPLPRPVRLPLIHKLGGGAPLSLTTVAPVTIAQRLKLKCELLRAGEMCSECSRGGFSGKVSP